MYFFFFVLLLHLGNYRDYKQMIHSLKDHELRALIIKNMYKILLPVKNTKLFTF